MMDLKNISPIGLGTWQLSSGKGELGKFWEALPFETVRQIVEVSIAEGVNWIDTAEIYGNGASESNLAKALKDLGVKPDEVLIADKWWPKQRKARSLVETIDQRLACLQGYPIGLYQIHWPESESWLRTEMKYLAKLVEDGKVQRVGLCNYNWRQLKRAHKLLAKRGIPLSTVQVRYSLAHRSIESNNILKVAQDLDIKVIAWSPLESGLLTGRFHQDESLLGHVKAPRVAMYKLDPERLRQTKALIEVLARIAAKHDCTASQIALYWTTHFYPDRIYAIPGASSFSQAKANAGAMALKLSRDELEEIDDASMTCIE